MNRTKSSQSDTQSDEHAQSEHVQKSPCLRLVCRLHMSADVLRHCCLEGRDTMQQELLVVKIGKREENHLHAVMSLDANDLIQEV